MKKFIFIFLTLFFCATAYASDSGASKDRYNFDDTGRVSALASSGAQALYNFPDIKEAIITDFRSISPALLVELMDTDDAWNIIPLKCSRMPYSLELVSDVGVSTNLVFMTFGVRFLPILEPSVFVWGGYGFEEFLSYNSYDWAFGVGASVYVKF